MLKSSNQLDDLLSANLHSSDCSVNNARADFANSVSLSSNTSNNSGIRNSKNSRLFFAFNFSNFSFFNIFNSSFLSLFVAFLLLALFSFSSSYPVDVKWFTQSNPTSTSPVVSSDYVFSVSNEGVVSAFFKTSGIKSWEFDLGKKVYYSPLYYNGVLYVPADDSLYAFSSSGSLIGNITLDNKISDRLYEVDGNIIAITRNITVYVISYSQSSLTSRNIIKKISIGGETDSSSIVYNKKLYVVSTSGSVYSIDLSSGSYLQLYNLGYSVWRAQPAVLNGVLYISGERNLFGVDLQGKLVLSKRISEGNLNSVSTDGENIYVGSDDGNLYSVSQDGSINWKFKTDNAIKSVPLVVGDSIYFASRDKFVYSISRSGKLEWSQPLSDWPSSLVYEQGSIYVSGYDGTVYRISTSSCRITNPEEKSTVIPIFTIAGEAHSDSGVSSVQVRTSPGDWQTMQISGSGENQSKNVKWSGTFQISGFSEGDVKLECRVADSSGNFEPEPYSSFDYGFVFSQDRLPKMNISYKQSVNVNQPLTLGFFNEQGTILTGVTVTIEGQKYNVTDPSGKFTYTPTKEGKLLIYVEKSGYQPKQLEINVTKSLFQPIYILIVFFFAVVFIIYSSIKKGTWR